MAISFVIQVFFLSYRNGLAIVRDWMLHSTISDAKMVKGVTPLSSNSVTLLLFYQYVKLLWDNVQFANVYKYKVDEATAHGITGRMHTAREG
jgi:hypothetical protein